MCGGTKSSKVYHLLIERRVAMGCGVTDNLQAPLCQHELNMLELLFMLGMTYVVLSQTTCYGAHAYNAH